jgi:hypothetical protein
MTELEGLQSAIVIGAKRRRLWHEAGLSAPFVHANECPRIGEVLRLSYQEPLYGVFNPEHPKADRYHEEFEKILENRGFEFERQDQVSLITAMDSGASQNTVIRRSPGDL